MSMIVLFCILHPEICISLFTKILQDSLLHLWYLYRFVQVESLSSKFYTSFVSFGIFINGITSYQFLCMLMIARLFFVFFTLKFVYHFLLKFYTIFFCILGICTDLSKFYHSLKFYTIFCILCLGIFINGITS